MKLKEKEINYKLGNTIKSWREGESKSVTFIVTEDCQLQCKYCYIVGKNKFKKMNFDVAKQTVDYLLSNPDIFHEEAVIWEFIGGEPFLEIELIDKISDYIKIKTYELNHKWFDNYRFSFSTNGLMYDDERVQKYIEKNKQHVSIGITIDGTKEKHDQQRVFPNNSGSFDSVMRNIPLWLKQFPNAETKVTIARDDIPFIKASVLFLWGIGIKNVNINVVFEHVWKEGDDEKFEKELKDLADEIIQKELYIDHNFTFFSDFIGYPLNPETQNNNWCGAGKMLAIDSKGDFFPCVRFAEYSMRNKPQRTIGSVGKGIDKNRVRAFLALDRTSQSTNECINCEVASGCAWCQGANYDFADSDTIYQRATYICNMHKARVRANNYYYQELEKATGIKRKIRKQK